MRTSHPRRRLSVCIAGLAVACLPAFGQQGAVTFKHFRSYPTGQWEQSLQAYRAGAPAGPPQTAQLCASPLNPVQHAAVVKLGNEVASMCTMTVLKDEERTAEYEQLCHIGPQEQRIHSTMSAVDDRTVSTEVRSSVGGRETSLTRITSRYAGPCSADQATPHPALPALPKLSKEQCDQLPEMKQQAADGARNCAAEDMPPDARVNCTAAMQRIARNAQQMESLCH